jgi:hypothetical protein
MLSTKSKTAKSFRILSTSQYLLPVCFLALTGLMAFNLLLLLFVGFRVERLAKKDRTFVQLVNGQVLVMSEEDGLYRHPEVIKNTVRQWATLTFDWNASISQTQQSESVYEIGRNQKVTTNAYLASYLLQSGEKGFRKKGLEIIADITPSGVFSGDITAKILISHLSEPRQIKAGEWEVDLVSTRILRNRQGEEQEIPFNRTFILKATDLPDPPATNASPVEQRVYQVRAGGLEITKISDLDLNQKVN